MGRYNFHQNDNGQNPQDPDSCDSSIVDRAIGSARFWDCRRMAQRLCECVNHMLHWTESCPCHGHDLSKYAGKSYRTATHESARGRGDSDSWSCMACLRLLFIISYHSLSPFMPYHIISRNITDFFLRKALRFASIMLCVQTCLGMFQFWFGHILGHGSWACVFIMLAQKCWQSHLMMGRGKARDNYTSVTNTAVVSRTVLSMAAERPIGPTGNGFR